jgi:hypothetical protein
MRAGSATLTRRFLNSKDISTAYRVLRYCRMTRGVERFTDLRTWQACDVFKKAVYQLCENKRIAQDLGRRKQIEESSSRAVSLMESQNHLLDSNGTQNRTKNGTQNLEPNPETEHDGEPRS